MTPWQKADGADSVRGNQAHEGSTSYFTGFPPQNINPATAVVQQGISQMTLKQRFTVPKGSATLSFWSLYQMEGDDRGVVEIASAEAPDRFDQVLSLFPTATALGENDPKTCDPTNPETLSRGFDNQTVDIGQYAGKEIILRFKLVSGAENRAASQPCGWYIDDLRVAGGAFQPIGESLEEKFEVRERAKGTYAYRVRGVYADGVQTGASNVETVNVTTGVNPSGGGGGAGGGGSAASACEPSAGFEAVKVRRLLNGRRLRFDFARRSLQPVSIDVFQVSAGRRIFRGKRVARFGPGERSRTWNGRDLAGRPLRNGFYFARFRVKQADGRTDVRRVTLQRRGGRFRIVKPFYGRQSCALLASAKLASPVFGGRQRRSLGIAFRTTRGSDVTVTVFRGKAKKATRRFVRRGLKGEVTYRLKLRPKRLRRATYRVRIVARSGGQTQRANLYARRL